MHRSISYAFLAVIVMSATLSACKKDATDTATPVGAKAADDRKTASEKPKKEDSLLGGLFGGSEAPAPAAIPTLDLGEFKIVDVRLGTKLDQDNAVDVAQAAFKPNDKIFASVFSTGKHAGLKLQARWTAPDGRLVAKTEQAIAPSTAMVSTFSIDHDQAWPLGAYTLEISLNEQIQKTTSFEIR